jgi:thiol-disulfide isomerase/thioredoxin
VAGPGLNAVALDDIDLDFRPRGRTAVAAVVVDGRSVLLDEDTGGLTELDETATLLWSCFDGDATIATLAADLAAVTGISSDTIGHDIVDFCKYLSCSALLDGVAVDAPEVIPAEAILSLDDIDLRLIPRPAPGVVTREVSGQALLLDTTSGSICALDPLGSVVWRCFDGTGDLADLVETLAEASGAPTDVVADDVLDLTRDLAGLGLLEGIRAADPDAGPVGLAVGQRARLGELVDLDGRPVDPSVVDRGSVLLVNWNPGCGYCVGLAPELAELVDPLAARGTRLVLVTTGPAPADRQLLASSGLACPIVIAGPSTAGPFTGLGTPVAYRLDGGRVASSLVQGSPEVARLARRTAGLADLAPTGAARPDGQHGMCGPGARPVGSRRAPRPWEEAFVVAVGGQELTVRADGAAGTMLVRRALADALSGSEATGAVDFSCVLGDPWATDQRDLCLLLAGDQTVVRSRSPRRVLLALAAHLSSMGVAPASGLIRTRNLAVVADGEAVLLAPALAQRWDRLQPRLARLGYHVVDHPVSDIDVEAAELVVAEPALAVDPAVLAELPEPSASRFEQAPVAPGRYRLRAWITLFDPVDPSAATAAEAPALAARVAGALHAVEVEPHRLDHTADQLLDLFGRVPLVGLTDWRADQLADQIARSGQSG